MMEPIDNDDTNQDFKITEKQIANFRNRMFMLTLEKSTPAIKLVFDKEIHPDKLKQVLNKNYTQLLNLYRRKKLRRQQWDRLFPGKGGIPVSSNTFDVTLMTCLLRNLTDVKISDRLPSAKDFSGNADISRLLYYRNMISHIANDDQFDYSKSDAALDDCIQAIQRLSGMDCNDYKTKLFGDCSKDCRVVIDALVFLYSEGCSLGKLGLSCAFWEVTHIEKMGELLSLCVHYKLLESVVEPLWKDLTEGKQLGSFDRFSNAIFNGNTTGEVPKWEVPPFRTKYWDEERRNSYFLCLAADGIKRCAFGNRDTKNEYDHLTLCGENEVTSMSDVIKSEKNPAGTICIFKSQRHTAKKIALKGTKIDSLWSSKCISSYCKGNNTQLPSQFTNTYSCSDGHDISDVSSAYLENEQAIHRSVFPCRQLQLPTQTNSSQSFSSVMNNYNAYYKNNDSCITNSAINTQGGSSYSVVELLYSFFLSDPISDARNYACSLFDTDNSSYSSVATNESVWNNSSSNGTDLAYFTGSGNDTGYCMIM